MLGAPLLLDANVSEENSNALLEEYFLQTAIGEHQNIVKFLLGGLFKGNFMKLASTCGVPMLTGTHRSNESL